MATRNIDFIMDGDLKVANTHSHGIFAQSKAPKGSQGDISLELSSNNLIDTNPTGVGVYFSGGKDNKLTNKGLIQSRDNKSLSIPNYGPVQSIDPLAIPATTFGYALRGEEGNEKITNTSQSTVIGNFNLGDGTNTIDNNVSANFITDGIMFVGPTKESFFNNKGLFENYSNAHTYDCT